MRKILFIIISLLVSGTTLDAQKHTENRNWKLPSRLENPAGQDIAKRYAINHTAMRAADVGLFAGLGISAASAGYMMYHLNGDTFAEAFGGLVVGGVGIAGGLAATAVSTAAYFVFHGSSARIWEENEFLHIPGNTQDMWDYQLAQKRLAHSKTAMWVSGLATAGLAGCTAAGLMIGNRTGQGDMILVAEAATYLGIASAAAFLASWTINAGAKRTIARLEPLSGMDITSLAPFVTPMPWSASESGNPTCPLVTGLALTARF